MRYVSYQIRLMMMMYLCLFNNACRISNCTTVLNCNIVMWKEAAIATMSYEPGTYLGGGGGGGGRRPVRITGVLTKISNW
jgi:hypothetical protein